MTTILIACYLAALGTLAVFGALGFLTLALREGLKDRRHPCFSPPGAQLPKVTVQLPVFNERYVVAELIDSAVALDYPRDRLQIQVIDDSSDDTTQRAAQRVAFHQAQGVSIELIHRNARTGFKAGALQAALSSAEGEFLALFDADFLPPRDFLRTTIPHLMGNPRLGLVQVRWEHRNWRDSWVTRAQAIAIDKHFAMEQFVRFEAGFFPKFNGSAGVWRRQCVESSGGWQSDTLCEDLCLSIRAALKGWQFLFLPEIGAPAELPATISAYKSQQNRWAQGSTQCVVKSGRAILQAAEFSLMARSYALLTMMGYLTSWAVLVLLASLPPLVYLEYRFPPQLLIFGVFGLAQPVLFFQSQTILYKDWLRRMPGLLMLPIVAVGIAPAVACGVLAGLTRRRASFLRTPKGGGSYRVPRDPTLWIELAAGLYAMLGIALCLYLANLRPVFFFALCAVGLLGAFTLGLKDRLAEVTRSATHPAVRSAKRAGPEPDRPAVRCRPGRRPSAGRRRDRGDRCGRSLPPASDS